MKTSIIICISLTVTTAVAKPVLQPDVKHYESLSGAAFSPAGLTVHHPDQASCRIGATEIAPKGPCQTWDGAAVPSGRGVFVGVKGTPGGDALAEAFGLDVPTRKQGYAIRAENGRVAIVGRDPVGALYGCVTFGQMAADGTVENAVVRDWPDFAWRGQMIVYGGLMRWGEIATTKKGVLDVAAIRAGLDEMMRHKLNVIFSFYSSYNYPNDPETFAKYREILAYARARGIRSEFVIPQAVFTSHYPPTKGDLGPDGKWPCVYHRVPWEEKWYCWSRDEQTAKAAKWWADFFRSLGATDAFVIVHPRDTGGKDGRDPEEFLRRCPKCRERYADGERWKATADQLNIFSRVLKSELPDLDVGSCVQPYQIECLVQPLKNGARDEVWKRNTAEFWDKVDKSLEDPKFFFNGWACRRSALEDFRKFVPERPYKFGGTYAENAGVFMTSERRIGTMYRGGDDERFDVTDTIKTGQWESMLLAGEYMWNTKAPGWEDFTGTGWYDPLADHTGPAVVMNTLLPAICRTFWGRGLAPAMTDFFASGVLPVYLTSPGSTVAEWNRRRKNAMYDPTGGAMSGKDSAALLPLTDTAELVNGQVSAAERALQALERTRAGLADLPVNKRIYLGFYLRRAPFWLATARVRAAVFAARAALEAGAADGGLPVLTAARAVAERDYAAAEANAKALDKQKIRDNAKFMPSGLTKEAALQLLDRAERIARAGVKADAARRAENRARRIAAAGVQEGRAVDFPVEPSERSQIWKGERVIDRPLVLKNADLFVAPGAKVVFRGEGHLDLGHGALYASGATFEAEEPMEGNFRIVMHRSTCWLDNCRFTGFICRKPAGWGTGFLRLESSARGRRPLTARHCTFTNCSSLSFYATGESEVSNCLFENGECGLCALAAIDTVVEGNVFRNLSVQGIELRQADSTDVIGNVFESCPFGTAFSLSKDGRLIGNDYTDCPPYQTRLEGKSKVVTKPRVINE